MIPVVLVTGFLGSGKTTLLRRLAEDHPEWRLVFLVNEFSDTGVDGETLKDGRTPTHSVVGGSLFCECKAGDFIRTMRESVLSLHAERPLDAVVIETSGIADPEAIGTLMQMHGLSDSFRIHRMVTVVAPRNVLKLLDNMPVIEAQIRSSDCVIVNKTDTTDQKTLQAVDKRVRKLNPTAEILHATYCRTAFDLTARPVALPDAGLATSEANPFSCHTIPLPPPVNLDRLSAWLDALPDKVLRIKGRVDAGGEWRRVEMTLDSREMTPCPPAAASQLVAIVHDKDETLLEEWIPQLIHAANE